MDSFQFLDGYQELQNHQNRFNRHEKIRNNFDTPEVKQIMSGPREWASFFDKVFYSFLEGYSDVDDEGVDADLTVYESDWSGQHLEDLIKQSQQLAFYDADATQAVNELNFHILSKEFMPLWHRAWMPEKYPELSSEELEAIQGRLANRVRQLKRTKNSALKWQRIEDTPKGLVASLNGQMTEIDAAIVLLEIQKENPQLLLLPASPQFESAKLHKRSVDFVITDTQTWQSRGIQVKTYIDSFGDGWNLNKESDGFKPVKKYDANYVTMIDGMIDLGNATERRIAGKGPTLVPNPGQISLNFLKDHNHPDILVAKNNITGRILHDLGKN